MVAGGRDPEDDVAPCSAILGERATISPRPHLPCAWGDVFDRLTILRIKCTLFADAVRLAHARAELAAVEAVAGAALAAPGLPALAERLATVNAALWDTEDAFHARAHAGIFDAVFIALARDVIRHNAARAALKREISLLLGSELIEEKLYRTT